jgi:hypothetical protein
MMTACETLNELAMSRSFKTHLIVEGETDQRLLQQTLPKNLCVNVIPAGNCEAAIAIAKEYQNHKAREFLRLTIFIDRDYQIALGNIENLANIIVSELRDIECMMFDSVCYDRVLDEYFSITKLEKYRLKKNEIKDKVISVAAEFGCIRFTSQKLKWNLSFSSLDYEKFVELNKFSIDRKACINHVNGGQRLQKLGSQQCQIPKRLMDLDYSLAIEDTNTQKLLTPPLMKARGHDLMELLCLGLRKRWGNKTAQDLTPAILEKTFRISFPEVLKGTSTFKALITHITNASVAVAVDAKT